MADNDITLSIGADTSAVQAALNSIHIPDLSVAVPFIDTEAIVNQLAQASQLASQASAPSLMPSNNMGLGQIGPQPAPIPGGQSIQALMQQDMMRRSIELSDDEQDKYNKQLARSMTLVQGLGSVTASGFSGMASAAVGAFGTVVTVIGSIGPALQSAGAAVSGFGAQLSGLGTTTIGIGTALSGGMGLAAKAAMDNADAVKMLNFAVDKNKSLSLDAAIAASGWHTSMSGSTKAIAKAEAKLATDENAADFQNALLKFKQGLHEFQPKPLLHSTSTQSINAGISSKNQEGAEVNRETNAQSVLDFTHAYKLNKDSEALNALTASTTYYVSVASGMKSVLTLTTEQLVSQSYALEKSTAFSHLNVMQVETMLLRYKGMTNETLPMATKLTLDLATAMGTDAVSAASRLGEMIENPTAGITRLRSMGVVLTSQMEQQVKAMDKSGDSAGALKIMLGALADQFGGIAVAQGDTFAGTLSRIGNGLQTLLQNAGGALLPALKSLTDLFATAVMSLSKFDFTPMMTGLGQIIPVIIAGGVAFVVLGVALQVVGGFLTIVGTLVAAINPVTIGLGIVVAGLALIFKNSFGGIVDDLSGLKNKIITALGPIKDTVSAFFADLLNPTDMGEHTITTTVKSHIMNKGTQQEDSPNIMPETKMQTQVQGVDMFSHIQHAIETSLPLLRTQVTNLFSITLKDISDDITGLFNQMKSDPTSFINQVSNAFDGIKSAAGPILDSINTVLAGLGKVNWKDAGDGLVKVGEGLAKMVGAVLIGGGAIFFTTLGTAFTNLAQAFADISKGDYGGALAKVATGISLIIGASLLWGVVSSIPTFFTSMGAMAWGAITSGLAQVATSLGLISALSTIGTVLGIVVLSLAVIGILVVVANAGIQQFFKDLNGGTLTQFEKTIYSMAITPLTNLMLLVAGALSLGASAREMLGDHAGAMDWGAKSVNIFAQVAQLQKDNASLQAMDGPSQSKPATGVASTATPTGKADGGSMFAGHMYAINERGQEMFMPGQTGTMIPHEALGGGGGNKTVIMNITVSGVSSPKEFVDMISKQLATAGKSL